MRDCLYFLFSTVFLFLFMKEKERVIGLDA